jgi:thiol-disulfide isomerase/thioredoxin
MANRKRPANKRPTPRPASRPATTTSRPAPPARGPTRTPWSIGGGIAVLVLIVAVIAIVAGGGDDDASVDTGPTTTVAGGVAPAEYQDVTVTGDPLSRLPDGGDDPDIGATPPTLRGFGLNGGPISIDPGASGKPMMVVFLAHWCPHCNREVPRLVEWHDSGAVPADLQIIGVSTAATNERPNWPPSQWIQDVKWPWPVMADSEDQAAAAAYGLPGYPYFVLIGADGTVKHRQSGEVPIEDLVQILAAAGIE